MGARCAGSRNFGCDAVCLNISETQNDTNRVKNRQQGLAERIGVVHGVFEDIPEEAGRHDVVWSQDAILHSDQRDRVLEEVWRVLKPGGYFVFTDPMQADDADRRSSSPSMTGCSSRASARSASIARRRRRSASRRCART